jgi:hypothetical protein
MAPENETEQLASIKTDRKALHLHHIVLLNEIIALEAK